ncbi:hypothetical protein Tco_0959308, partial [Tanacetum coccineum]
KECEDLRQRFNDGLLKRPTIVEIEQNARLLHEDITKYGKKECFASCLFVCNYLIRPDVALKLTWLYNMIDFAFPYLLQFICEYTGKVDDLIKDKIEAVKENKAKENEEQDVIKQQT